MGYFENKLCVGWVWFHPFKCVGCSSSFQRLYCQKVQDRYDSGSKTYQGFLKGQESTESFVAIIANLPAILGAKLISEFQSQAIAYYIEFWECSKEREDELNCEEFVKFWGKFADLYQVWSLWKLLYRTTINFSRLRLKYISLSLPPRGRLSRNKGQLKVNLNLEDPKCLKDWKW